MRYGICGGPEIAEVAARTGFTYFEWTVGGFLQPLEDESAFQAALEKVRAAPLPCPAVNVFLPGSLKITGPEVDWEALDRYVRTAMERAQVAGVECIVFGSGGARRIPEGFSRVTAMEQLLQFGGMAAEHAAAHGVGIAVEPLNTRECNVLTSVQEAASYVRQVGRPSFRLLVDAYHWALEAESVDAIMSNGDLVAHAHIATPANRLPPGVEPYDFGPFLGALQQAGYQGRLSIEAKLVNPDDDLHQAITTLRRFEAQ
jgi:sugar phosphate isomerase/epimerase